MFGGAEKGSEYQRTSIQGSIRTSDETGIDKGTKLFIHWTSTKGFVQKLVPSLCIVFVPFPIFYRYPKCQIPIS
jgi:hypothetical protein